VPPKGQDQKPIRLPWHRNREMVVDALIQFVQHRQTQRGGEFDLELVK
jgi:hypothetical protein